MLPGQLELPFTRTKAKPPGTAWVYHGHSGWYAAGWLCARCFGFWTSFLALRDAPPCDAFAHAGVEALNRRTRMP